MPTGNYSRLPNSALIPGPIRGLLANRYWGRSGIGLICWGEVGVVASVSNQAASVSTLPGNLLSRTFCNSILLPALSTSMPTSLPSAS